MFGTLLVSIRTDLVRSFKLSPCIVFVTVICLITLTEITGSFIGYTASAPSFNKALI